MDPQKENRRSIRKKRTSSLLFYLPVLFILIIGVLFFFASHQLKDSTSLAENGQKPHGIWRSISQSLSKYIHQEKPSGNQKKTQEKNPGSTLPENQSTTLQESEKPQQPPTQEGAEPSNVSSGSPPQHTNTPAQATDTVKTFFFHLDTQPYIQAFHLDKTCNAYFTEIIRKLLDSQPIISRETDDLYTVLKNTAHFYRVIGKENITLIKAILDQEKSSIEAILANSYTLIDCPSCLQENFSLHATPDALYNYASFFLNTMGGRLYLFRRDSVSRMMVNYYSILIVDKANRESNNRNGIQIKQAVDGLIAEIENSGSQLRLKERYLDKLYELKEKYQ
jgi:hypothetical protein